jgi:hypothetical protein
MALIVKEYLKPNPKGNTFEMLKSLGLFALVWGFLGLMIGLITAFDAIESFNENINPAILAGGLKIGLLAPSFGAFTFLIVRLGIIGLLLKEK